MSAKPAATSAPAGTNVADGQVAPSTPSKVVQLQRRHGTEWRTVGTAKTRASSGFPRGSSCAFLPRF